MQKAHTDSAPSEFHSKLEKGNLKQIWRLRRLTEVSSCDGPCLSFSHFGRSQPTAKPPQSG